MQQVVRPVEGVRRAELDFQHPLGILAPQRAHPAVGVAGPGKYPRLERRFPITRQLRRTARTRGHRDGLQPPIPVGVRPGLHEALAAAKAPGDVQLLPAVQRPTHHAVTVTLRGVAFTSDAAI